MNTQADKAILAIAEALNLVVECVQRNCTMERADQISLSEAMTTVQDNVRELWEQTGGGETEVKS